MPRPTSEGWRPHALESSAALSRRSSPPERSRAAIPLCASSTQSLGPSRRPRRAGSGAQAAAWRMAARPYRLGRPKLCAESLESCARRPVSFPGSATSSRSSDDWSSRYDTAGPIRRAFTPFVGRVSHTRGLRSST